MSVEHVEVLVEEPSMEAALLSILPKVLGGITFQIYTHRCKDELLLRLQARLLGYSKFMPSSWRIVVIVDRDGDDCATLKSKLERIADQSKLTTKTRTGGSRWQVVNRIVIEELEAWYFGDWAAVRAAYPRVPETIPTQAKYRHPDAIQGTWEAFEHVMQDAGYFKGGLRKIEVARAVGPHMDPRRNQSRSFQVLCSTLHELAR